MVVVEERGTPAGLRQALRETRRERGRAAPTGEELRVLGCPFASTIYRGRGRAAPPPRVPTPRGAAAPNPSRVAAKGGEGKLAPQVRWVRPLPQTLGALGPCGGRTSPPGAGPLPHLAHAALWGRWPHLVDPRDPPGGPGTLPIKPETFPVTQTGLPIYKSLPPDHFGTPHDVRDLIRDSEQHSVTTYSYSYNPSVTEP